jgi:hypothetical protein
MSKGYEHSQGLNRARCTILYIKHNDRPLDILEEFSSDSDPFSVSFWDLIKKQSSSKHKNNLNKFIPSVDLKQWG